MRKIILFLVYYSITTLANAELPEQQFACNKNNTIYQCSILTDGYYAIKTKTYDEQPKFEINDYLFEEIKEGIFDEGNIIIKNGIVKQCKKCNKKQKERTHFLIHKYIVFNKIPNYKKYIKNNKIDNLEEFNKNGYFLAFRNKNNKNDNKYLFIYKDVNDKLKSVYNNIATFLYFYDEDYFSESLDLFYLDIDNLTYEKFNNVNFSFCNFKSKKSKIRIKKDKTLEELQEEYNEMSQEVKQDKERLKCMEKVYSLDANSNLFDEDAKKNGDDIVFFDKKKREKIIKILKKADYDFLK